MVKQHISSVVNELLKLLHVIYIERERERGEGEEMLSLGLDEKANRANFKEKL